ncbi:MAG: PhnD/SsuA/transferrin family substrate-binding protein, partial [Pseudobdellovibrionaceae bacterium]
VQYYLQTHGIDLKKDIEVSYVGSQESSILSPYHRETAAGATWPPPLRALKHRRPEILPELKVLAETEPLINNSLVVRDDIDPKIVEKVKNVLLHMHENERGRAILQKMELSKFESATNDTYKPVQKFIKKYDSLLGAVE